MKAHRTYMLTAFVFAGSAIAAPPSDPTLLKIVDDARLGRIELCRDPRWPMWRFDDGEEGRTRLTALKTLVDAERKQLDQTNVGEPFTIARERAGLLALSSIIASADAATDRASWSATFGEAANFIESWRAKALTIGGDDFAAIVARRSMWRLARARTSAHQPYSEMFNGAAGCLVSAHGSAAEEAALRRTFAILDRDRWPSDARDGRGAETDAMAATRTSAGNRLISAIWRRLVANVTRGRLPAGALPLWRIYLNPDPNPVSTLPDMLARFETDWTNIDALLRSASRAATIGEELYRRTRLEQYGRLSITAASRQFPAGDEMNAARAAMWKKTSDVDVANTQRVKELLKSRLWFDDEVDGDGAENFSWLIVQHSDLEPDFQREVLGRLEPLLEQGRVMTQDYALLWDRVAVADKRPQRYGTQFSCAGGAWVATGGVKDPDQLDARRRKMGLGSWQKNLETIESLNGKCPP